MEHVGQLLRRSHQEKCAAYSHHVADGVENCKQLKLCSSRLKEEGVGGREAERQMQMNRELGVEIMSTLMAKGLKVRTRTPRRATSTPVVFTVSCSY